jgi:hypothetical protein
MTCYNKTIMNILTTFAQSYYDYSNGDYSTLTPADSATAAAAFVAFSFFFFIFAVGVYVVAALCLMSIFKKAGVKPWIAWVPFYNQWKFLEIGGQQGFWAVLAIIPVVNIVSAIFVYIAMYHVGKKLGKEGPFVLLGIFLPLVWYIWLAVDKSTWNDQASTAPSLAK